jgi:hypothetical protein
MERAAYQVTPGAGTGAEWLRQTQPAFPHEEPPPTGPRSTTCTGTP